MADVGPSVGTTDGATGADGRLSDAARLRCLRDSGMLGGDTYASLDRLARAAAHQLRTSGALVSLVTADRRVVAGSAGRVPEHSFCRVVVDTEAPLLVCDARTDERVAGHPAIGAGLIAYAGFPVRSPEGYPLGAFAVLDGQARDWEPREVLLIEDLATAVESEIALRTGAHRLAETAQWMRDVLDNAQDAFVSIDIYGAVTAWNATAERQFGYPAAEAIGRPVADLIIPERFRAAHAAGLARMHSGGVSTLAGQRVELTARNRAGGEFPVEMTLQVARYADETIFHAFLHDISGRAANRRQLEHERTFLQALLDSLDSGVAACDADGRLTLFNQAMRTIHGVDARPVAAEEWAQAFDLYGPDGHTPLEADEIPLARAYDGQRVDGQELVVVRKGAAPRRFHCNARQIVTPDGRRLGAVVAMRDVTQQRRTEMLRELRLTVARGLADAAGAAEGADRTVAAVCRALGWAFGEFWQADDDAGTISRVGLWVAPGHDLTDVTMDRAVTLVRGAGLPGHIWQTGAEVWLTEVAGDPRTTLRTDQLRAAGVHSAIGMPIRSDDRVLGVLIFFGADAEEPDPEVLELLDGVCAHLGRHLERRRAEDLARALADQRERLLADQRAQNDQLRHLDRVKDELVALVSHELCNPLGAIRNYGEALLEDPDLTADQRHLAGVIHRRSGHMQALVDGLLDLARLDAGKLRVDPRPLSAEKLVLDVVQTQQPAAAAKDLTVSVDTPAETAVRADPVRLRQVLDNLLANAIKYTPVGGRVTVTARPGPGGPVIAVADTGIGIPAEEYPHLFDRFFRASNAVEQGIKGTGLGLAICRAIVEAHGGTLSAAPAPGGGTVFTVTLPLS
jgi:PAS domain S-box-containing protein